MAILGADRHTAFAIFGSLSGPTYFLTNGVVFPDHVHFAVPCGSYAVSNSAGGLRIDGSCGEHPFYSWHANVATVLVVPILSLPRVSGSGAIEFTVFNGRPGQTNVIEASTDLDRWTAISTNVFPSTDSFYRFIDFQDTASTNLTRRFFRAFSLP